MADYFDPLYGRVSLPDLIWEIVSLCPEVKRLRDLSLTNSQTIALYPLTKITRLEHALGVAYLTSLFLENTLVDPIERNNLLAAAVLHDVGGSPFGHTVEWALKRYVNFDHEKNLINIIKGTSDFDIHTSQVFYEGNQFNRRFIQNIQIRNKYHLDPDLILQYLNGTGKGKILAGSGIDLDNIDNVFRMSLYCGDSTVKSTVVELIDSLHLFQDEFVISFNKLNLVQEWLNRRYTIYDLIIYDKAYLSCEYLLTRAVEEYFTDLVSGNKLQPDRWYWSLTDSKLIQSMYENPPTSLLAARLQLFNYYDVIEVFVSSEIGLKKELTNLKERQEIETWIESALQTKLSEYPGLKFKIGLHCTTDFGKRFRSISINCSEINGRVDNCTLGETKQNLVIAILSMIKLESYPKIIKDKLPTLLLELLRSKIDPKLNPASQRDINVTI